MRFVADVVVSLKPVVNDPQGLVVRAGLHQLGFAEVGDVRVGKHITLEVDAANQEQARQRVADMCERLLRNPVIEDYGIELRAASGASPEPLSGPA
ncbi:MAG: phosphoribosylformylglycinamidine synthase subunit PurS [Candidatus Dormibacteria bacterium]|jgi:phosphoribosylformylglycinamidine synthase